jgi:3-oxoacyl-[acyl-carrier-protein] synthase-3
MHYNNIAIMGLGYIDAPVRMPSAEIEEALAEPIERFGMRKHLIRDLSGIHYRHLWHEGASLADKAREAAEIALADSGVDREKIGVLINTSVSKDYIEPSTASLVHGDMGLGSHCINFDVSNACLGFVNGIQIVAMMIERGQVDYGLVVNAENSRPVIEATMQRLTDPNVTEEVFRNNFASLTLGSGAVAMVIGRAELANGNGAHRVVGDFSLAATQHNRLCLGNMDQMVTDASGLLKAGITLLAQAWPQFLEEMDWGPNEVDLFAIHQVSEPHTWKLTDLADIPREKVYKIFTEYGNMGPVGIPVVLAKAYEEGQLDRGDKVALFGVGSGLNCSLMGVEW